MILKSFILGNPLALCMKILNSVVVVGLYYGFMTTFSIGPSYLFLLRARVMEEGNEREVSATTGFIAGQLIMFISIYYAPLHLALGRPHTITVLVLPYLLFHFFWNNHKNFFDYGSTNRNSMRNLSIQCVFLNNLIFQLFNHFILPSSTLARLVNIYMFRCNNKILFLTSSFVGWLIGHILFMKGVGLVLFWIRQNRSIRSNKYLVSELRNSMDRIFSILLFITCVYYLGRMPSPIVTNKLKDRETSETEEGGERKEESYVETTYEMKETEQEQEGSTEENLYLCSEEKEDLDKIDETEEIRVNGKEETKDEFDFQEAHYQDSPVYEDLETHKEKKIMIEETCALCIDPKRWNRPLRYIKNDNLENALRNEMSQFFFFTCTSTSDGKQRISFTYPPSLSTFLEMLEQRIFLDRIEKLYHEALYNSSIDATEKKKYNLKNELKSRIQIIEKNKRSFSLDKRTILCDDEKKKKCLPKAYDPFFNGPYRGTRKKFYSRAILNTYTDTEDLVEFFLRNKIHDLLINDPIELHHQSFLNSTGEKEIDLESQAKYLQFVFDVITTHTKDQKRRKNKYSGIRNEKISKKVSRWSYKLNEDMGDEEEDFEEEYYDIYSRRTKRVILFHDSDQNTNFFNILNTSYNDNTNDEMDEVTLTHYLEQSDFRRNLIKGSMRAQRRKTVILNLAQANVHSRLFLDRIDKKYFFPFFKINEIKNLIFRNWMGREQESEFKISYFENKDTKEEKAKEEIKFQKEKIEISEAWENLRFAQGIRSLILVTQSFLRKYIILPSLIIAKNLFRILVFQISEWNEDFKEWNREIHIKCTYEGAPVSETEFPEAWLVEGMQIKIFHPFCLKPWRKSKARSHHRDLMKKKEKKTNSCYLTVWGLESERPFGSPLKRPFFFFFETISKELQKRKKKVKKKFLKLLQLLRNEKRKSFLKVRKKETKGVTKIVRIINLIMKKLDKVNTNFLFEVRKEKIDELNEKKKDLKRNSPRESSVLNQRMNWFNYSLIERRMKDISDKTIKIRNQMERIEKDKKKKEIVLIYYNKRSRLQKRILKILKRKNIRLIRKSHYFLKSFIEKMYIYILLCRPIIVSKINAQLLFEFTKKILNKSIYSIYNNEIKKEQEGIDEIKKEQEGIDEINKNTMNFILTTKKLLSNIENTKNNNKNSNTYWNLSSLSQAYVFYKISQNKLLNRYQLRPVLQYQESYPFFKDNLKDYCMIYGIFNSKARHKQINTFVMNEWKNWLKGHYQYDLSQKKRSPLAKEWKNRIYKHCMIKNKESNQLDLDKKYQFIYSIKENDYAANSFMNQKDKWKKHYRYDLLSYKYISLPNLYISGLTLETNGEEENFNTSKPESFYVLVSIPNNNYLGKEFLIDRKKNLVDRNTNLDRKYFDFRILHLCFFNNLEICTNAHIGIKIKKNTKTEIKNFEKMEKKDLFFPTIHQEIKTCNQKSLYDNDTTSNHDTISNLETWFFPEFVLLFNVYKIKPWIIPIKSLFFHFSINEKSQNKSSNKKEYLELVNSKQEENQNFEINKEKKKNEYKTNNDMVLDFFLKNYLLFQLRWPYSFNQKIMKNLRIYCLLLRLINPTEIVISSIQRGEINIDEMLIQRDLVLTKLIRKGIFLIEPICLSIRTDEKSIIYQTIDISLVDNNKHQTKEKYTKKRYIEKREFEKSSAQYSNLFLSGDKNDYDLLVPENILSPRRRREFRIRICLNSRNFHVVDKNPRFCNENKIRNCGQFLNEEKHINTDRNNFIKFKLFLWPNYRLEDLACMNRYWFDANNSTRFSMSRIHMY